MLQSQDEQNVILVTYKDLKKALSKVCKLVSWQKSNTTLFSVSMICIFKMPRTSEVTCCDPYVTKLSSMFKISQLLTDWFKKSNQRSNLPKPHHKHTRFNIFSLFGDFSILAALFVIFLHLACWHTIKDNYLSKIRSSSETYEKNLKSAYDPILTKILLEIILPPQISDPVIEIAPIFGNDDDNTTYNHTPLKT